MAATIGDVLQQLRSTIVNDPGINAIIGARYFPQKVDLEEFSAEYPYVSSSIVGGYTDTDNYKYNTYYLDFMYVSKNSIDEALKLYDLFNSTLNQQRFILQDQNAAFVVTEDSTPVDISGVWADNILYIYINSYKIRKVN